MIAITNGKLITLDGIKEGLDLIIKDKHIHDILEKNERLFIYKNVEVINANGGYISPGFIDIHADYIENIAAPRPSSLMDFRLALREAERELLTHGVTTMYHSLSLYKVGKSIDKPIRKKENVSKFIDLIKDTNNRKHLIRHKFHARYEIDNLDNIDELKTYINEGKVDMLSFMDHTPGQGQFNDVGKYKEISRQYGNQMTDEEFDDFIKERNSKPKLTASECGEIVKIAKKKNIAVASHDDDSYEKLKTVVGFGTTISEFPITLEVAKKAKEMGMHTIAGAPNVLLGGSHSGNLAAYEAIQEGAVDIICSDYYPAAILHSIFKLHKDYGHDLNEMFKLVTINPAKAVNIDNDLGSLDVGKKADIIIIEEIDENFPVITSCFVDGRYVFQTNYRS
ncbi:MAG: phosphonate metabolism protein PhnM [Eubacteriales bacterium]